MAVSDEQTVHEVMLPTSESFNFIEKIIKLQGDTKIRWEIDTNDVVWFRGKEIASMLEYVDTDKALRMHVDDDDKLIGRNIIPAESAGLDQYEATAFWVNECGLYSLILRSDKPAAKRFKSWVTSQVLPAIRKTGSYTIDDNYAQIIVSNNNLVAKRLEYEEMERERVHSAKEAEKADAHKKQILELKIRQLELERDTNKDEVPDISGFTFREVDFKSKTHPFRTSYAVTMQFLSCGQYKIDLAPQQMALLDKFKYDLAAWSRLSWSSLDKSAVELAVAQVGARWDVPFKVIHGLVRRGGKSTARLPLL